MPLAKWQKTYMRKLQGMTSDELLNEALWTHADYRDSCNYGTRKDWKYYECRRQLLDRCYRP